MKSTKIKDLTLPSSEYDLDMPFTIVCIEENKSGKLGPQKVRKSIVFIPLDKFLNSFNCTKKDAI